MSFLKAHARFLIALIVLTVLVSYGYSSVNKGAEDVAKMQNSLTGSLKGHYARIFKDAKDNQGNPATVQALVVGEKTLRVQELEDKRNALMSFRPDPRFTLEPVNAAAGSGGVTDADKLTHYYAILGELKRELIRARYFRPDLDNADALGFNTSGKDGIKGDQVPELLYKLDIVREVCHCVERSGVQVLDALRYEEAKGADDLANRGLPVRKKGEEPPYFEVRCLNVSVRGNERALYNLLIELQRPVKGELRERYLAVEKFDFTKADLLEPANDLITANIRVIAYHINKEGYVPGDKAKEVEIEKPASGTRFR